MNHKVPAKPDDGAGLLVKVIDRSHQIAHTVPVGEHLGRSPRLPRSPESPGWYAWSPHCILAGGERSGTGQGSVRRDGTAGASRTGEQCLIGNGGKLGDRKSFLIEE